MPIGKGERGEQRPPDDWERINTEWAERARAQRAYEATHDPSPEWEAAARPLPEEYGRDRPKHRNLTPEQRAEVEEVFGRTWEELQALREKDPRAGHNRDEQGRILGPDGNPRQSDDPGLAVRIRFAEESRAGSERPAADSSDPGGQGRPNDHAATSSEARSSLEKIAEGLRTGQLTAEQAADQLEAYRATLASSSSDVHVGDATATDEAARGPKVHDQADSYEPGDEPSAWERVEGEKPERAAIHVGVAERIHILDGDGQGGGGHVAGTGIPMKSEFPATWDDEKIIGAIEDVARNPDHPPELQDHDTWLIQGTREGVGIRVVVARDGAIVTGYPETGVGVIRNDRYGNPLPDEQ